MVEMEMERLTRKDFDTLSLEELAKRTGLEPPGEGASAEEVEAYRDKAYESYMLDKENRDEWGTATQATEPPKHGKPKL
jgi:hypothetical protein